MAQTAVITAIHNAILDKAALGNSKRGLKEVASDLCNQVGRHNRKGVAEICNGTFLCKQTIYRVMDCEENYRPQAETLERILRHFNVECRFEEVVIKPRYQNKPKGE